MIFVFIGPPGSGKGTQAVLMSKRLGLAHISTGDMLREAVSQSSVLGLKAKAFMDKGELVPDEEVISIIKARVSQDDCKKGFILDGYPRTSIQAKSLDKAMAEIGREITKVISIEMPEKELVVRLSGRRVCRNCRENYNLNFSPPKNVNKCDKCGGEIYQRDDDKIETIQKRFKVYTEQTATLINYYQDRLINIAGNAKVETVEQGIHDKLKLAH
ncbi:MAG: adenylate kinase [Candidatus Brocadiia bacterium]